MSGQEGEGGGGGTSKAAVYGGASASAVGCASFPVMLAVVAPIIVIFGGLGVILYPLIAIIMALGGGGDSSGSGYQDDADSVISVFQGDGKGELDASSVPEDLVDPIQEAGELCDDIGPIVIAAQIQQASGFNSSVVGEHGEVGISQLPPDVFTKYGKDDDDNDKTQATDDEDSIMAQGRYMCDLAKEAQQMIDNKETDDNLLDLALAGYKVGMEAVRAAKGVPDTNEALGYVVAVRAHFATYAGTVGSGSDSDSDSDPDSSSDSGSDSDEDIAAPGPTDPASTTSTPTA